MLQPVAARGAGADAADGTARGELSGNLFPEDPAASLSLLLQGPLVLANHVRVAGLCKHWRAIFPQCPIVLAVSGTDILRAEAPGRLRDVQAAAAFRDDPAVRASIAVLGRTCDAVVLARPAAALPPVKEGLGANHANHQIAAAQAGLAHVATEHVLRIRNDMAFTDASVFDDYLARRALPRGAGALLGARVLISPFFTLDPLTLERLPFHFSDWFHLGRTQDVRALWNVPEMTFDDATYYNRHPMRADSGPRETGFHSRLAVEQHLVVQALAGLGRDVRLDYHNDPRDVALSYRTLADEFVVADLARTPILFEKYKHLARASDMSLLCSTAADWHRLVEGAGCSAEVLFAGKIADAEALLARDRKAARCDRTLLSSISRTPRRWWRATIRALRGGRRRGAADRGAR